MQRLIALIILLVMLPACSLISPGAVNENAQTNATAEEAPPKDVGRLTGLLEGLPTPSPAEIVDAGTNVSIGEQSAQPESAAAPAITEATPVPQPVRAEPIELDVLFVGNSYTHGNKMPGMVRDLAWANGAIINLKVIAPGGAFLFEHASNGEVTDALTSGDYDFVVLQEQSIVPAYPPRFNSESIPAAKKLVELADSSSTSAVWFETWGHRNGNEISGHTDYSSMQQALTSSYAQLGDLTGSPVARVGTAWSETMAALPQITLHADDGSHATQAGSYLAAVVITDSLLPEPLTDHGDILFDENIAKELFTLATT